MPIVERFFSPLRFIAAKRYLLIATICFPTLLLLGPYLYRAFASPKPTDPNRLQISQLRAKELPSAPPSLPASAFLFRVGMRGRGKLSWPGILQPPTQAAEDVDLRASAEVIGVCVGGRSRAYCASAFSGDLKSHLVNDLLAGHPVTVAYCELMRCSCAFTATDRHTPLDVTVNGWTKGKGLILSIDGVRYAVPECGNVSQPKEPPLPYQRLEHERTTWIRWLNAHPDTDVYTQSPTQKNAADKNFWPGIRQPPLLSVDEVDLDEKSEVIGVCVGGRSRAYALDALSDDPVWHVVNDLLAGRPVTVAYCDRTNCARVFTNTASSVPLDLGVGGWNDDKGMMLSTGSVNYALKDGENLTEIGGPPLSFQRMEHERTTWGQWRRLHPDTDVYALTRPYS